MSARERSGPAEGELDLARVETLERASLSGWPPRYLETTEDGWILRATPGLNRGRSSHALTPMTRRLSDADWDEGLEQVRAFSARHGIRGGVQISPLELHAGAVDRLLRAGWEPSWEVWVMRADRSEVLARSAVGSGARAGTDAPEGERPEPSWVVAREATPDWLTNWELCEPKVDRAHIDAHARTAFGYMGGRGRFGRLGHVATGIAVEDDDGTHAGLFALVVREEVRGRGLGRRLVSELAGAVGAPVLYLQVTMDNMVALSLYRSLGFTVSHSYQHLLAPPGWAGGHRSSTLGVG